jgi:hypothetical protein
VTNGVRNYLAGLCHGVAVVWLVGYVLYKTDVPLSALFNPRDGLLVPPLALLLVFAGCGLIQYNLRPGRHPAGGPG